MPTRTANTSNQPSDRSQCWWGTVAERPSLPSMWLAVDLAHRDIVWRLERLEEGIVELVTEVFAWWEPFDVVTAVRLRSPSPSATSVIVNAVVAASHTTRPLARGRRQIEFLVTACPDVFAGVGWLRRLHRRSATLPEVLSAAVAVHEALADIDELAERARWSAA